MKTKFKDYYKKQDAKVYTIYLDMDGVLCDFEKAFDEVDGKLKLKDVFGQPDNVFWDHIAKVGFEKFYAELKWLDEGKELWEYVKDYPHLEILSSLGDKNPDKEGVDKAKTSWLKKYNIDIPHTFTPKASAKQQYANGEAILIDDFDRNITQWNEAGGVGILFTTAEKAIKKLKELGI